MIDVASSRVAVRKPNHRPRGAHTDPQFAYVLTTPGADGHRHCATVLADGEGQTAPAPDGHRHQVSGLEVLASSGHEHELSAQRCAGRHVRGVHL